MANQVLFHPTATSEYEEAYLWYEEQREGLGLEFQGCVEKQLRKIIQKPLQYSVKKGQHREAMD